MAGTNRTTQSRSRGDYATIGKLGHFLKGSSAQIGLSRLRYTCQKIQNVGRLQAEDGQGSITATDAVTLLTHLIPLLKKEYAEAEAVLRQTFGG